MPKIGTKRNLKPVDVHVGARVRSRRMQLGMSQTDLANKLGLTFQQVQKYEKGVNRIGASRLYRIASILDVPPQYFFEDPLATVPVNGGHMATSEFIEFCASRDGLVLMEAFVRIKDKATRHKIAKLVEGLAG